MFKPFARVALLAFVSLFISQAVFSQTTYYSRASGSWSDVNTWSVENHAGSVAPQVPGGAIGSNSTDVVIIAAGHTVLLDLDREISGLTVGTPVQTGILTIGNDNVNRYLSVRGPVVVDVNGTIQRNTALTEGIHTLEIKGDNGNLTNNGILNFTDLARPVSGWSVVDLIIQIGGNVTMGGTAVATNSRLNKLTVNKNNRSIKLTSNWTVAELLYIQAGYLELGDATTQRTINGSTSVAEMRLDINGVLRIYGTSSFPTGYLATLDGTNGTIEYAGTNQSIASSAVVNQFPNLLLSGTGTKSYSSDTRIVNNLTISAGTTLSAGTFKTELEGNYTNSGTFTPGTGLFRFIGSSNQFVTGTANFNSVEIALSSSSVGAILSSQLSVSSSTSVVQGVLDLGTITTHSLGTVTGSGTIAISAPAAGTTVFPAGTFTAFLTSSGTGTVEYNGTTNYSIGTAPLAYANLKISGASTKTLSTAATNVAKDLYISSGTTLSTGANTLNLTGNFTNDGTLTGTGTVVFNNTTTGQTISGATQTTFQNLTVAKASGIDLTLANSIRVNGTLALANLGNVVLGSNNLTVGPTGVISGSAGGTTITSFSSTRMIQQDGTNSANGVLIREGTSAAALVTVFPVGTGSIYSYATITQLTASITGTAYISIKAIPFSTVNNNIVKRYWLVKTSNITGITNARLTFKYDPSEISISGSPTLIVKRFADNVDNDVTGSFVDNATTQTFGVNAAGNTFLESEWRAGDASNFSKTYYSYQSGSWDVPNNWTTDPTGTILQGQPGVGGPNNGDRVIILNGRTMFMASINKTLTSLEIESGGTLDIKTFGGHNFGTIRGAGLLRIATTSVPSGNFLEFVSPVGGTVEYYDYTGGLATNIPYYNHVIMSGTGTKVIGGPTRTITVNGNFSVTGGTAVIGSGAGNKLTVNIFGDVTIAAGAFVTVGNEQIHELNFYKNVITNGSVDLTNAAQYADATGLGAVVLTLKGSSDNSFTGTATKCELYRLIIDKGVDQTYILDLNPTNLALFGPTGLANGSTSSPYSAENPEIFKALWVKNGTLKLGSNISIPRLSSGGNDFFIPERGAIWLNGATVATYDAPTGSPGNTGLTLYGKLRVTSGAWNGAGSAGIVYRTISEIIIEGGVVTVSQLRASTAGTGAANNRSAYVQTAGEFIVNGTGENNTSAAQFSLDKTSTIFRMSGGTIRVRNTTTTGAIDIRADAANYEVTGGLVEVTTNSNNSHLIRSTVPFYNFTEIKGSGTGNVALSNNNLVVLNDFNINTTAVFNANNLNLSVGRNFNNQGTYTTGTNTTIFTGSTTNQTVTSPSGLSFHNVTISNTFSGGTVTLAGNLTTTIAGNLTLTSGTFNDGGETVTVRGSISNSATHTGTGRIRLNNSVSTVAVLSGTATGTFRNLELNDTDGATLSVKQNVTGVLTLTAGVLDLKQFNLTLTETASISVSSPGSGKMIKTAGNRSDGGLTKVYSTTGSFTFPIGVTGKYTPATINVTAASNFGSISVNPVNTKHPFVTSTNALNYYWEVKNTGFTGTKTISSSFSYVVGDVVGLEVLYIGGFYDLNNPSTWTTSPDVNSLTHVASFNNVNYLAGEYTAGVVAVAFNSVIVFYSRVNGNWETNATWSTTGFGGVAASATPGANNPVFIGDGNTINHTVTITTNGRNSGNLKLNSGSTLDLGVTTGHNFGAAVGEKIKGNGKLRISSSAATAQFPSGDFGEFIVSGGGTVEYYYTATDFKIPATSASSLALSTYMNLIVSPGSGTITFPDINLTIYNDLTTSATTVSGKAAISNTTAGLGNLDILHDLIVAGTVQFMNGQSRSVNVTNLLQIQSSGNFNVSSAGTVVTNLLNLYGGMINNGVLNMNDNTRICDVTFLGTTNTTLTGTGSVTDFNRLIVNKGTTQTPLLEVNLTNFTLSAAATSSTKALDLQNGTFKLSSSQTLTISSGTNGSDYLIPFTSQLWLNGGNLRINTTGTGAGLLLAGKLKIDNGTFYIEGGGTNDNYIEVAGGGEPSIEVNAGELRVGSQVRRANTSTISALSYSQSGGTVTIGTQAAPNTNRALLEVLNDGSYFSMSGGTLIIARQQTGTPTIAALYLQPSTSVITGGTIQLGGGSSVTPVGQNIQVYSSIGLYDVLVNSVNAPTVTLTVGDLTIKNNLTISTGSTFNASDFDVYLQRNFVVNGTYSPGLNTTYFNSSTFDQVISGTGTVTFYNLAISNSKSSGVVSFSGLDAEVTKTLDINSGTLSDNTRTINVKERVNNYSIHTSTGAGKIVFSGTAQQILSGNGSGILGNVEINNTQGVLLEMNHTINGALTFTNGIVDIRSLHLTLGQNSSISGTTTALKMIRTNGTLSDQGVTKNFGNTTFDFTFPIGSSTKYTPARFTATANTAAGTITVKPINRKHPSTTSGFDALDYYWNVTGTGFSGLTLTHRYTYSDDDINGSEAIYQAARFTNNWTKGSTVGSITSASNLITIDGGTSGINYTTGDYTAGDPLAFQSVTAFTTAQSGDWDVGSTWVGGVVPAAGAPVVINNNHQVTLTTAFVAAPNSKSTFSLEIRPGAKLTVSNSTFGHNFGNVLGAGTISLSSGIFPGGAYDLFVNTSGGTVEYTGTGYSLSTQLMYNHVVVNSSGTITLPNADLVLRGNLTLSSGILDNSVNNKKLSVQGNWINNVSAGAYTGGTGSVEFAGSNAQTLGGTSSTTFTTLEINKALNSVTLGVNTTVNTLLKFVRGNIVTTTNSVTGGSNSTVSHVLGQVVGNFTRNVSTSPVVFPVGTAADYLPLTISFSTGNTNVTVFVEGVNPAVVKGSGVTSNPVTAMWSIEPVAFPVSATATAIFQYPDNVRSGGFIQSMAFAARWNTATTSWQSYRLNSSPSPNEDPSRVTVTGITAFSSWGIFHGGDDTPLPIVLKSFDAVYQQDHVKVSWVTSSEYNNQYFAVEKSRDGKYFSVIGEVPSKGSTSADTRYSLLDWEISSGLTYYRLHQVDIDGTKKYFHVVAVDVQEGDRKNYFAVYPNPTAGMIHVKRRLATHDVYVLVMDVTGKIYRSKIFKSLSPDDVIDLDMNELRSGTYMIKIVSDDFTETYKITRE